MGLCAGCAGVARQCQGREGEGGSADQHLRFHRRCGYAHLASGGYRIPCFKYFDYEGGAGKVINGFSGYGASLYVPASLLEDAKEILEAEPVEEPEQPQA